MEFFKTYFLDPLLNHYADFKGKATRKQYWLFSLNCFIISLALNLIGVIVEAAGASTINFALSALSITLTLALFIPSLSITARRLHDTDRSAWWLLLCLPSLFSLIESIALGFLILAAQSNSSLEALVSTVSILLTITLILTVLTAIVLIIFMCLPSKSPTRYDAVQSSEPLR